MRATARVRTECLFLTEEVLCQVSYGGMAGEAGFEPALQGSKPSGLPITPFPIGSHLPDSNRQPSAYKAAALPLRQGGIVRSAGVEPATSWLSTKPLCQVGVRARGTHSMCAHRWRFRILLMVAQCSP